MTINESDNPADNGSSANVDNPDYEYDKWNTDNHSLSNDSTQHQASDEASEVNTSFGEPLQVNVTRGTSRFQSIQRIYSKPQSVVEAEEGTSGLEQWLIGQQQTHGPPFAKRMGLVFDKLSVFGSNFESKHIPTLVTPLYKLLKSTVHGFGITKLFRKSDSHRQLLHEMSGVVADGEMLLVLGRPGAGCSTLLRVLGNLRSTYRRIDGSVSYGGLDPETVRRHYRGEVAYNQEEDVHFPTLTVRKTLEFAIQCKMPSTRMLKDRDRYGHEFLDTLLDMYGLEKCADTIVGDAYLRGVSGGERKRVSIAEQVASGASVDVWDGSTRGLDSSSALDYVRSLRITTDVLHKATVVTIYQASENIYDLFDKVMVVDGGRQLYFGPASAAVEYFRSIGIVKPPRQTTSDFLTGVTQLHERRVLPGWEDKAPKNSEDFERIWLASPQFKLLQEQVAEAKTHMEQDGRAREIRAFVDDAKMGSQQLKLRRRSPYITTFMYQFKRLLRREWEIVWGGRTEIAFMMLYFVAFAVIGGTLFLKLPETSNGAFTRGGVLFFALLFNSLAAEVEIPQSVVGREVVYKHKALAMYHPAALSLAQTIVGMPFITLQIVLFSVILYFTAGLALTVGQFFAFLLFLLTGVLCLAALFRLIGNLSPDVDFGLTVSGIGLLFMVLMIGYLQPPQDIRPWFKWIYWINPLAYAFKSLMCNEFRYLRLECTGSHLIPSGGNISHQVCTLKGARSGERFVDGRDYLADGFQFYMDDQWINFIVVLCLWILFVLLNAGVMEWIEFGNTGYSTNVYKRYKPRVKLVTEDSAASSKETLLYADIPSEGTSDKRIEQGANFTWQNINYMVPVKGGERQLLDGISGYIKPGTMTALMGSSGAGKTTLLDSLSQRKTIGRLNGEMLMNGSTLPRSFRRVTGYCEQLDVHNPLATVREALRFSAYLRQLASVPAANKDEYVEHVIFLLGLTDIGDCLIGDAESGKGISLEERKRLTIGVELVARPKILFLDEPTSGLDAQASFHIVCFLRRLAAEGQTILCTIHQPSAILFEQFDRLLLLVRGGHTAYFGNIGQDAQTLIEYFERNGADICPPTANPAEYILDIVGKNSSIDWPQTWMGSEEREMVELEIGRMNALQEINIENDIADGVYAHGHFYQTRLVLQRMFVLYWRNLEYNLARMALQVICALAVGFTFFNLRDSSTDLQNKVMGIFFTAVLSVLIINQVQPEFLRQRKYYARESSTNQYGWGAFTIAIVLVEWPFAIVASTLFFIAFYWTVGLNGISERIGYFFLQYQILGLFSVTLGQAIAAFSPNEIVAAMIDPVFSTIMMLFCGVTITYSDMPKFWRAWMYWLSPYMYYIEGVITNDLHGAKVECNEQELFSFEPPKGQSCLEYAGDWIKDAAGYMENPNATGLCQYCPYSVGDEYYHSLNWNFAHRYRNFGIMVCFVVFNVAFTALMIRFYKFST